MNSNSWNELEGFVRKESGIFPNKMLDRDTSLEDDLDITGDDSDIFMEKFFDHFSVDLGDFDIDRYFFGEGAGLLSFLLNIFKKYDLEKNKKIPLTLKMLEKSIELGRWDTAIVENSN